MRNWLSGARHARRLTTGSGSMQRCALRALPALALLSAMWACEGRAIGAEVALAARPLAAFVLQSRSDTAPEKVQASAPTPIVINIGTVILAEPAADTPLPIQIGPQEGIPKNSFVRIRGLPPSVALSEGHSIAPGAWAVPLIDLPTLRITVPVGLSGRSQIAVALVTIDGATLAEAKSALLIAPSSRVTAGQSQPQPKSVASIGPAGTGSDNTAAGASAGRPPRPEPPQRTPEQQRALRFVAKGNELLSAGDIATARLFYQRAVDAGLHEGALAMAATYDPNELARYDVMGLQPDVKTARVWYERARELGAPQAEERLRRLGAR